MLRLGQAILEHRRWFIAGIGIISAILFWFFVHIGLDNEPDKLIVRSDPGYPLLEDFYEEFSFDDFLVVPYKTDRNILNPEDLREIKTITEDLDELEGVERVLSLANAKDIDSEGGFANIIDYERLSAVAGRGDEIVRRLDENPLYKDLLISEDRKTAIFDIILDPDMSETRRADTLLGIRRVFGQTMKDGEFVLIGSPVVRAETYRALQRDFATLAPFCAAVLAITMYLFIGQSFLPVIIVTFVLVLSAVWTYGIMDLTGTDVGCLSVMIPAVLFVIGTSDCIHILSRYQECAKVCKTKKETVATALGQMILPCFMTALTTAVGFAALMFMRIGVFREFGLFTSIGIAILFFLAATVVPYALFYADTSMLTLSWAPKGRGRWSLNWEGMLSTIHAWNMRHKKAILIVSALVIAVTSLGVYKLQFETDALNWFEKDFKGIYTGGSTSQIEESLKDVKGVIPFFLLVSSDKQDGVLQPSVLQSMDQATQKIRKLDGVENVVSIADIIKHANMRYNDDPSHNVVPGDVKSVKQLHLLLEMTETADDLKYLLSADGQRGVISIRYRHHDFVSMTKLIADLNAIIRSDLTSGGMDARVTGLQTLIANTYNRIKVGMNTSMQIASVTTFLIFALLFRSFPLAFLSMVPNMIPIGMTLGALGLLGKPLNFATAPLAAVSLGLAVDDTIHFLAELREQLKTSTNYEEAIRSTMIRVGKPMLRTSLILGIGFVTFALSAFKMTQTFGLLISITMISAILGDMVLQPVLLQLFKPMKRLLGAELPQQLEADLSLSGMHGEPIQTMVIRFDEPRVVSVD